MIPKRNIIELTGLFRKYYWLVNIPICIYFGATMIHIGQMKKSIHEIGMIVKKDSNKGLESLLVSINKFSVAPKEKYKYKNSSEYMKNTISRLRWKGIETSSKWENEINNSIAYHEGMLGGMLSHYDRDRSIIEIDKQLITHAGKYPELRKFISYRLAESIIHGVVSSLGTTYSCEFSHRYFNPVIQRFGDDYFVYPDTMHEYCLEKYSETKVNGRLVRGDTYEFRPKHRGMHRLEIEVTFWGYNGIQKVISSKGLMVL